MWTNSIIKKQQIFSETVLFSLFLHDFGACVAEAFVQGWWNAHAFSMLFRQDTLNWGTLFLGAFFLTYPWTTSWPVSPWLSQTFCARNFLRAPWRRAASTAVKWHDSVAVEVRWLKREEALLHSDNEIFSLSRRVWGRADNTTAHYRGRSIMGEQISPHRSKRQYTADTATMTFEKGRL